MEWCSLIGMLAHTYCNLSLQNYYDMFKFSLFRNLELIFALTVWGNHFCIIYW